MTNSYLVSLSNVTPNRATVESVTVYPTERDAYDAARGNYDVVTDETLVPAKGERVWVEDTGRSSGRRPITARARG